jgi:hypothetical protein
MLAASSTLTVLSSPPSGVGSLSAMASRMWCIRNHADLQAEAVAEALADAFQEQIATRADILIGELRASLDKIVWRTQLRRRSWIERNDGGFRSGHFRLFIGAGG